MKNYILVFVFILGSTFAMSQSVLGKWKTIDDETGEAKSIVEIYEQNGKVYGKIADILNPARKNALCEKCEGADKNKPVLGLVIIKDMEKSGKYYKEGTIFDPEKGKEYTCRLYVDPETPNTLQVRGYISFLYKSQYWKRVE